MSPELWVILLFFLLAAALSVGWYLWDAYRQPPALDLGDITTRAWAGATPSICWPDQSYPIDSFVAGSWPVYGTGIPIAAAGRRRRLYNIPALMR
jgi:hypothetical protein